MIGKTFMLPLVPLTVAGGLLAASAVTFKHQKAVRLTLAALLGGRAVQAIVPAHALSAQPASQSGLAATLRETANAIDDRYQAFMHRHFDRLFGAERDQQMQEISEVGGGPIPYFAPFLQAVRNNVQGHSPAPRIVYQNLWLAQA